jgi:hypothetical protein
LVDESAKWRNPGLAIEQERAEDGSYVKRNQEDEKERLLDTLASYEAVPS